MSPAAASAAAAASVSPHLLTCRACRRTGLTPEQFRSQFESRNRPVLLTDGAADWPALTKWDQGYLAAALAGRPVGGFGVAPLTAPEAASFALIDSTLFVCSADYAVSCIIVWALNCRQCSCHL